MELQPSNDCSGLGRPSSVSSLRRDRLLDCVNLNLRFRVQGISIFDLTESKFAMLGKLQSYQKHESLKHLKALQSFLRDHSAAMISFVELRCQRS